MRPINNMPISYLSSLNKERIESSFSMAAKRYDRFAVLQKEVAGELQKLVVISSEFIERKTSTAISELQTPNSQLLILDIGCGTGFLTHGLTHALPEANVFGCDISHAMVKVTSCKLPAARDKKMRLLTADCGALPYKDKIFDRVASNLTYQWIHDIKTAFSEVLRVLRPGGIFIFSTLGPETLKELRHCYIEASSRFNRNGLPPFMGFSDKQMLQSALENAGFKNISIKKANVIKTYPDMWALLRAMKSIGAGNPFKDGDKSLARGSLLKNMAEVYREKFGVRSSELGVKDKSKFSELLTTNYELYKLRTVKSPNSQLSTPNCIYATYEVIFVCGKKEKALNGKNEQ